MEKVIAIPEQRKGVLIGPGGAVKQELERRSRTRITVKEDVTISGEDVECVFRAADAVQAIGSGFPPEKAFLLLGEDVQLQVVSMERETEATARRLLARVIGRSGKARKKIEEETGALVAVFGKTVSVIGTPEQLRIAVQAVEHLLDGHTHGYAYTRIEHAKRKAWTKHDGSLG